MKNKILQAVKCLEAEACMGYFPAIYTIYYNTQTDLIACMGQWVRPCPAPLPDEIYPDGPHFCGWADLRSGETFATMRMPDDAWWEERMPRQHTIQYTMPELA